MNPSVTSPRAESAPVDETESSQTGGESRARSGRRSVEDRQRAVLELMSGKATVDVRVHGVARVIRGSTRDQEHDRLAV